MADSTQGRVFTEDDVALIVDEILVRSAEELDDISLYRLVAEGIRDASGLTFPADEPVYVLRASDPDAPECLEHKRCHYTDSHAVEIDALAEKMREWQAANPDRVKVPDTEKCAECGLSHDALGPDGEPWHEGGECPGPPCGCGSGFPQSECADQTGHVVPDTEEDS